MPNFETKVDIEITLNCHDCGGDLSCDIKEDKWGTPIIGVDPCSNCLLSEYERGIEEGKKNAS